MRAPKKPIELDDTVIVNGKMVTILNAMWSVYYSQWRFNVDNKNQEEFYENSIEYYFDANKNKWKEY